MNRPGFPRAIWWVLFALLIALRLPALAQPAAADQSLYAYAGQQLLAGHAPYSAAWDQKPPGIHYIYAALWALWPHESAVAAVDTVAAVIVALALAALCRAFGAASAAPISAALFLILAHPSLSQRLSGVFVRGQSEVFIGLLVTTALLGARSRRTDWTIGVFVGVCLGAAVWIKYNAIVYALPISLCMATASLDVRQRAARVRTAALALVLTGITGLALIAMQGALPDLWWATFRYNIDYSRATYQGVGSLVTYILALPIRQAQFDALWFLGGVGALLGFVQASTRPAAVVAAAWIAAAVLSIAINSARDLPQYFVQAWPALGFAAGLGLTAAFQSPQRLARIAAAAAMVLALWRVGVDRPVYGVRLAGLPGLVDNIAFDLAYLRGRLDRETYLERFGGQRDQDKFVARDVADLAAAIAATTRPEDTILVFGFSPGVYVKSHRQSASRFFWSRPVVIEFAADQPGYGVSAFLAELQQRRPAVVVLQKQDWGPAEPNSAAFFLGTPVLADWLRTQYRLERDMRLYSVWRRVE